MANTLPGASPWGAATASSPARPVRVMTVCARDDQRRGHNGRVTGQRARVGPGGRAHVAVSVGRAAGGLSRLLGRGSGTAMPGRVALFFAPDLAARLTAGRTVVLVSGTNGKTTTTRYVATALRTQGPVLSNHGGANLRTGVASALLASTGDPTDTAVLEVDEAALPAVLAETRPAAVVLLNLSRDQLDRTSEVAWHARRWGAALTEAPEAVVVANADDPLVCSAVLTARPDARRVVWVGAGQPWTLDCPLCPRCSNAWEPPVGNWECRRCGFARPAADWQAVGADLLVPGGRTVRAGLGLPGRANVANAAMALAAAASLGASWESALDALRLVTDVGGRYLRTVYAGRDVRLLLAKNPAGWAEVLEQLAGGTGPVVVSVNARAADGRDTSWLWDVPFEQLAGRPVVAAGDRAADVSLRLRYAGVPHAIRPDVLSSLPEITETPGGKVDVVANYTAFATVRDALARLGRPGAPDSDGLRATRVA